MMETNKGFYCKICGKRFQLYMEVVEHILAEHRDKLSDYQIRKFERQLRKTDWTCEDCIHAGLIYYNPHYWGDDLGDLRKGCPKGYFFNHPNPRKCPRFIPIEEEKL